MKIIKYENNITNSTLIRSYINILRIPWSNLDIMSNDYDLDISNSVIFGGNTIKAVHEANISV